MEKKIYELTINEELDTLFPELDEQERALLEKSILEEGCTDPIISWNGVIVDGHHRYRICRKHNIPFAVKEMEFQDNAAAMKWMISRQLGRRNLSNFMKAKVALRYEEGFRKEAEKNKKAATKLESDSDANERRTDARLGKLVGLSRDTIAKSRRLAAEADEETKAKLDTGELSVNKAYTSLNAKKAPGRSISFRHLLPDDMTLYTVPMDAMFEEQGDLYCKWGETVKENVKDQTLASRSANWAATQYAFGNAMLTAAKGIGEKKSKACTLSDEEMKVIESFDKLLETFDEGVKAALDEINPFTAHRALFETMMRKLKEAYIGSSSEVFSFLWDVERLTTQRFGTGTESGKCFDEMIKAEKE